MDDCPPRAGNEDPMEHEELIERCLELALDKKAEEPKILDMVESLNITDHFLLVSAQNRRQAQAIASSLDVEMKHAGVPKARIEGYSEGWWILMDFDSLVVHIFQSEAREYYGLDRLWADAADETQLFLTKVEKRIAERDPGPETEGSGI